MARKAPAKVQIPSKTGIRRINNQALLKLWNQALSRKDSQHLNRKIGVVSNEILRRAKAGTWIKVK